MHRQQFQVRDRQVCCVPEPAQATKAGLKMAGVVELLARTEVTVSCKATHASSWLYWSAGVAQPCSNQWHYAEDGIVIGSALKTPEQAETVIPVMNLPDEPCTLYRGTCIGEAHVITKYGRVEGLLPSTLRYDDDSEDSEDEGWLRDGRIKYRPATTLQGRAAFNLHGSTYIRILHICRSTCSRRREGVSEYLTLCQREELAAVIHEFREIFSSGPTDMGSNGLVKHTIDIVDQRAIHLPPRHLPIAKQEIEL